MFEPHKVKSLKPLRDHIIVSNMNFLERKSYGGIILRGDDAKLHGIRPRWCKVYAVGPEQTEIKPGQWIYVTHGRWTRGVTIDDGNGEITIRRVDNDDILLVSDEEPVDDTIGDSL